MGKIAEFVQSSPNLSRKPEAVYRSVLEVVHFGSLLHGYELQSNSRGNAILWEMRGHHDLKNFVIIGENLSIIARVRIRVSSAVSAE